jgi:hypothetical protein
MSAKIQGVIKGSANLYFVSKDSSKVKMNIVSEQMRITKFQPYFKTETTLEEI